VDAATPSLSVREGYGIDHLIELVLAGDEDSLLHARTTFGLSCGPPGSTSPTRC